MKPVKQSTYQGCLVASLAMAGGCNLTSRDEKAILVNGLDNKYGFYVIGVVEEFIKKFGKSVEVFVDNEYFTKVLQGCTKNKKIKVTYNNISMNFLNKLLNDSSVILYIDYHSFGDYSHYSHFILVDSIKDSNYKIVDPVIGKFQNVSGEKLDKGIKLLREHIKMCPLILKVK